MDYRENEESTLFSNKLVLALSYVILATFIFLAILIWYQPQQAYLTRLENEGITTSGIITKIKKETKPHRRGRPPTTSFYLSISFMTREGSVTNIQRSGSQGNFINQRVEIIYLSDSPEKAEIKNHIWSRQESYILFLIISVFITTWIFVVTYIQKTKRRRRGVGRSSPLFSVIFIIIFAIIFFFGAIATLLFKAS